MTLFLALLLALLLAVFLFRYYFPLRHLRARLQTLAEGGEPENLRHDGAELVRCISRDLDRLIEQQTVTIRRAGDEQFNLRAILGSMKEGVLLVDAGHRIRMVNDEIYRLLPKGISPINRTPLELFRNHLLHRAIENSLTVPGAQTSEMTIDIVDKGQLVPHQFEVTVTGMRAIAGGTFGALAVFHDITRLKALESMRKEFVANVSHELRTPLAIISGYLETLLDDDFNDPVAARKFLRVMRKHTERLHLLVEDLLIISQLESQKTSLDFAPASLPECLETVVERLEPELQQRGAKVRLAFPRDFPLVEMDEHRIDQVFFNLLDNALKHGGKKPGEILVRGIAGEGSVRVSVQDHGPGIPIEEQPHIFERFYRVDRGRSREMGGTGLGLSIVKHVVQAHGGTVEVESRIGEGATFHVTLPVRQGGG